jgi:hypothetical protein
VKTDAFINKLDPARFERTNGLWNRLMLNDPWSVGYVTTLIEAEAFRTKEEWEYFYYKSGESRNDKIETLSNSLREKLNDEQLVLTHKNAVSKMSRDLKNLNYNFGRTKEQIAKKGAILFEYAQIKKIDISEEECTEAVRFRTICQTWNGIIIRERNTIKILQKSFPSIDFISTEGNFDYKFAVDYELKLAGKLICGIQIKPKSYLGKAPHILKAQNANQRKNQHYKNQFRRQLFTVISKANGEILNTEILTHILGLIKKP